MIELETGNISIIPAHSTPLRAMALSPNGNLLATASESVSYLRLRSSMGVVIDIYAGDIGSYIRYRKLHEASRIATRC